MATFFPTRTDVSIKSKWKKMQRHITKELMKFSNCKFLPNKSVFSSSDCKNSYIIPQTTSLKEQGEYVISMINEEDSYILDGIWTPFMNKESSFDF